MLKYFHMTEPSSSSVTKYDATLNTCFPNKIHITMLSFLHSNIQNTSKISSEKHASFFLLYVFFFVFDFYVFFSKTSVSIFGLIFSHRFVEAFFSLRQNYRRLLSLPCKEKLAAPLRALAGHSCCRHCQHRYVACMDIL